MIIHSHEQIAGRLDGGVATVLHVDHELVGSIGVERIRGERQGRVW